MQRKTLLACILLTLLIPKCFSQSEKFKALFMYNFTKYLEWPANKQSGDFVIGIYGASPIINELEIIAQKRKVGNQPIVVKRITTQTEMNSCNIVYFPKNKSSKAQELSAQCSKSGVVLITDKPGFANQFSGINYVIKDGKQNFEVNRSNIELQGVNVNSSLLSLGIPIN